MQRQYRQKDYFQEGDEQDVGYLQEEE